MRILSTKKLKLNQRELLLHAGASFVAYDAIKIEFLGIEIPSEIENAIFTSQNGVRSIQNSVCSIHKCFCVGQKTKLLLEEKGLNVVKMSEYGAELADFIVKNHKKDTFHFFCSEQRLNEIPDRLKQAGVELIESNTYRTVLNPKKFSQNWDGILFFSPSGVQSFISENSIKDSIAFCIGTTTAAEAKKYTENVVVSNATSVESVIAKAVKTLKK